MSTPEAAVPPLLQAQGLRKHFALPRGGLLKAVDEVDLAVQPGECFGIVGESGSGKSTLARLLLRLMPASGGQIRFDGQDITDLQGAALRRLRRSMQIVFQNPHSALNGRHTIFDAIAEPLRVQESLGAAALRPRVFGLMEQVQLPANFAWRYPHELSGGQKQRVCIARALATQPRLVVLDEPTSALDVSVQAQILALLRELQREHRLTYLFISHNLAVVRHLCDRVGVLYLGRMMEQGDSAPVFTQPQHPYTRALLAAAPRLHDGATLVPVTGDVPSAAAVPSGCRFRTRCPEAEPRCAEQVPVLQAVAPGQHCACLRRGHA